MIIIAAVNCINAQGEITLSSAQVRTIRKGKYLLGQLLLSLSTSSPA